MLYYLSFLSDQIGFLNVFKYTTFRSGGGLLTSLFICLFFGPALIKLIASKQGKGQPIRNDGPKDHIIKKAGTPTMGGLMILLSCFVSLLLWARLDNPYILICFVSLILFGFLGFIDDYLKVSRQNSKGLSSKLKIIAQIVFSIIVVSLIYWTKLNAETPLANISSIYIPFLKNVVFQIGFAYFLLAVIVIVSSSNAVNLTDGLDGLAIMPVIIAISTYGIFAYVSGHIVFSSYLNLDFIRHSAELMVVSAIIMGSGFGFLWFNAPPAMIFMGDTGSLSLGALLGAVALMVKQELLLLIVGGLFVLEASSVIIQIISFKLTGKRIFRMSPIHHHFEQKGWNEATIVIRFWMIAFILAIIGLMTLKLR